MKLRALASALILLATSSPADDRCIATYGTNGSEVFFTNCKRPVAADNRARVVRMVRFPIDIMIAGNRTHLKNRSELLKYYDVAFDPKVKGFIGTQKFEDLFCNWQGVMIGRGEIWVDDVGKPPTLKITAINNNPPWSPGHN